MAENIRKKIQLYRTAQSGTTASDVVIGELAMNYNSNSPFVMFKDNIGNIQKLGALSEVTGSSVFHTMTQKAITDAISSSNSNSSNQFDKIEASIGLANDGSYVKTEGDYTSDATTIAGAIDALDSALKSEETDRIAADNALQDAINAEASARTAADNAEASARTAADNALQDAINAEASARTAADNALQAELDKTQTNIGLNADGTYTQRTDSNYINEATTVVGAINELDEALKQTTSDLQDYVQDYVDNMNVSEIGQSGSYISSVKQENGKLAASTKVLVDANDDVLTFTENGITSTISIAKLTDDEVAALGTNVKDAYKLIGKNNEQLGQTIKIYKDQSLKSVTFDGNTQELVYTYIVSDGSESEVRVNVSAFLTEEEYGNGLQVINHVISAKLGEDTATNKNFLDLEGEEEGKKSLAVRSIDTDRTYTTEEITVMGGPLAKLLTNVGINKIDAGTDIQSLLMTLLCKEIYPYNNKDEDSWYMADEASLGNQKKVGYQQPNFTNSIGAPTIAKSDNSTTVEAGTRITYTVTVPSVSTKNTASTVSNLTWGYSSTDDDKADSTSTSITKNWANSAISNDVYTLKTTLSKFNGASIAEKTGTNSAKPTYAQELQVEDGANSITVNVTGCSYSANVAENSSVYMVSNLGKTDAAIKTNVIAAKTINCTRPTSSATASVTGVRFVFAGGKQGTVGISNAMELTSANVRSLGSQGNVTSFELSIPDNTSHVYIALPPGKTLKTVIDTGAMNAPIEGDFKANTYSNIAVEGANNYTSKNYTVYVYAPKALLGANKYNVTIQ